MYSSIASLHIALDSRLLLLNSNRKVSIHPQQYDMAINDAIHTLLKQRFSPELNSKKQGFEESIKRYTDLSSLKRIIKTFVLVEGDTQFFYIPSNCYLPISCNATSKYRRAGIETAATTKTIYQSIITVKDPIPTSISIQLASGTIETLDISKITNSSKSMFYTLNYLKEHLEEVYGLDCYIENFNNIYKANSLIVITDLVSKQFNTVNSTLTVVNSSFTKPFIDVVDTELLKHIDLDKHIDLVSTEDFEKSKNDYYSYKNIHLNPYYKIVNSRGIIKTNSQFKIKEVTLEYIKQPRLVNSILNRMTDVTITDEILDIATTNLSGILENPTYQINKQQEQFNN